MTINSKWTEKDIAFDDLISSTLMCLDELADVLFIIRDVEGGFFSSSESTNKELAALLLSQFDRYGAYTRVSAARLDECIKHLEKNIDTAQNAFTGKKSAEKDGD